MMFKYARTIFLHETDSTGVLYFSEQLKFCGEAFEAFLTAKDFNLHELIELESFLMPVVHAETDFIAPLRAGDHVEIYLTVEKLGTSSFTLKTELYDQKRKFLVGKSQIVHVTILKETGKSTPIPKRVLDLLSAL